MTKFLLSKCGASGKYIRIGDADNYKLDPFTQEIEPLPVNWSKIISL